MCDQKKMPGSCDCNDPNHKHPHDRMKHQPEAGQQGMKHQDEKSCQHDQMKDGKKTMDQKKRPM